MATRTYRQTARAEATDRTRRAILDAIQAMVLEDGRYDVPLEVVAGRAGVSTRTLLRHFGSRDGAIEAAFADGQERVSREREPVPGDVAANLARLLDHYERVGDGVRRMLAVADRFPLARRITEEGAEYHRAWVEQAFADDLRGLGAAEREHRAGVLATVTDLHVWDLLRHRHHFDRPQVEAAMRGLVEHARGALP